MITGASSGIGAATARAFAAAGANLVLNGRDASRLQAVADSIVKANPSVQVQTLIGDTGKEETHKQLIELALSKFGALHIVFNNAGIFPFATLQTISSADIDALLDVNVKGIIYGLKYQLPALAKSASKENWGVIVNNSSAVTDHVRSGMEAVGVYASTKAAVDTLTKFGALEGASTFVRVLSINPGFTASEGLLGTQQPASQPPALTPHAVPLSSSLFPTFFHCSFLFYLVIGVEQVCSKRASIATAERASER